VRPCIVFLQGELVDRASAGLIERVLGTPPVGLYGLTELGYAAWQCERRAGYHVNAETCIVEVLRHGRPAQPGELGEVVATNLSGRTAPLLRYRTGDLAVAADGPCPCGRTLPLLRSIEGRAADVLALPDGRAVTPRELVDHMAPVLAPDRYRVRQEEPARLRLHVYPAADIAGAADRLRELVGAVEIEPVPGLPPAPARHKSRPVESALTGAPLPARA
jgi:phenylacetate-CoA ligase